ncbi:hypothetical protein [Streptomyces sp. 891-h]|uniref:hypothetical protein n=1 Tax=Streptomyces sp. 891-h TaxID=2720714 RepID=UPI001FAA7BEB|nr:hypothetical protein [Streptomyces sp. 891-h]UNZ20584.1 hypothetical protein HC362_29505 [Streptomyces sp. 891-h]
MTHPLPVGTRVRHIGQQWHAACKGTATIREIEGPYSDGAYEYRVLATEDFSRRPSLDNPETRETWWASYSTIPAAEVTR